MSRFERLCWAWAKLNNYALRTVAENASARVFRFEDIFESDERYDFLFELLSFVTDLPEVEPVTLEALEGWLERQIHKSSGGFPRWADWSLQQRHQFEEMCSALMERLGYSLD